MKNKVVYICSPFRAVGNDPETEMARNIELAKRVCKSAVEKGYVVFCPHLFYPQFLNDAHDRERELGMAAGLKELELADELWVVGNRISEGMSREISRAGELGIPTICVCDPMVAEERLLDAVLSERK